MHNTKNLTDESKCVHAGIYEDCYGAVVPPIYQTSTFKFKSTEHGAKLFTGEEEGYIYTRLKNPTIQAMEDAVAGLEGGVKALGCASGMAAIHTVFNALLNSGDHIICSEAVYGPTTTLLNAISEKFDISVDFVDTSDANAVENAAKPTTKLIFVETPANPTLVISDLEKISEIASANNARLAVDNTFMSPVLQKPFEFGADIVVHSMTKFLNGHADVVAGIIIVKTEEMYDTLRSTLNQLGGVIDPFNSFLVHRGIKTLALRMKQHCDNAMKIANWLETHPKVDWVRYPGLKSHPQHEVAKKQMKDFGGMIAFELKGGIQAGKTVMNSVELAQLAVSLGGVETLIQHPASMTHSSMDKALRLQGGITDGLVRLSVGIENADELIADLDNALGKVE
jgi:methionine-gamma-lyase